MKRRNGNLVIACLVVLVWAPRIVMADVAIEDTSFAEPDGNRVLQQSVVVSAPLGDVWHVFTTAEGLMSWAVPFAVVDFRLGGHWETSYRPDATAGDPANIRSRIISYLPMKMLSLQAEQAPPGFPNPELLDGMFSVFHFEPFDDDSVRITVSGLGYGTEPEFDNLYEMFQRANEWTLRRLHERFAQGPVAWDELHPTIKSEE